MSTSAKKMARNGRIECVWDWKETMRSGVETATLRAVMTAAIWVVLTAPVLVLQAQETQEGAPTPEAAPVDAPVVIPASEIPSRSSEVRRMLREARKASEYDDLLKSVEAEVESEKEHIAGLQEETTRRLEIDGPASVIEEAEKVWIRSGNRLDEWLDALTGAAESVNHQLAELAEERSQWELTKDAEDEGELPEAVRDQVEETLQAMESARVDLHASRDALLILQSDVARQKALVEESLAIQREEIERRRRGLIGIDSPPIWKAMVSEGVDGAPSEQVAALWSKNAESVRGYVADNRGSLIRHALLVVVLTIGVFFLRRKAEVWVKQDRSLEKTVRILDRPFAAALVITILLGNLLHPGAPSAWHDFMGLILLFAILRLLPRMLVDEMQPVAYQLALLFFLRKAAILAPDGNFVNRFALLTAAVAGFLVCLWLLRRLDEPGPKITDGWRRALRTYFWVVAAAFLLGAVADVIGSVGFSTVVTMGTFYSLFSAVLLWVATVLIQALVRVGLLTRAARSFGLVRLHADTVRKTLFRWVRVLAVAAWVYYTLEGFMVVETTTEALGKIVEKQFSIGDFSIAPADVLIFLLLIWLSFKISQLLRFVLDTDVMPRMDLPRGVPAAINRITHYTVILTGLLIAGVAAGLDFSRLSLIIGALGVGIGFGLQNVVNNFVSGLILLFERPIRVGDKIQLTDLYGKVKDIGMRASVVRTFQGAEVIVPNASLISAEVINWTLSDDRRRMELPVGVAYGTDVHQVMDLLAEVAGEHPEVLNEPNPQVLFLGFGASSLDFQVRAWTRTDFVRVSSELLVAVNDALVDAGIEIPFPQRDLHLRSVDTESVEILKPQREGEPEQ
jgi:small-conductance mechanosensitive channel